MRATRFKALKYPLSYVVVTKQCTEAMKAVSSYEKQAIKNPSDMYFLRGKNREGLLGLTMPNRHRHHHRLAPISSIEKSQCAYIGL